MSPVTGLARQAGRILSSVHMGNLIPVTEMKNVQKASYGKNFQLGYRDLGNQASPPSHMNTSKFL